MWARERDAKILETGQKYILWHETQRFILSSAEVDAPVIPMLHQFSGLHLQYKSLVSYKSTIPYSGKNLQLSFPKAELIKPVISISFVGGVGSGIILIFSFLIETFSPYLEDLSKNYIPDLSLVSGRVF